MEPLFFIALALVLGAATRHFMKNTPIPFTVLLMTFGLIIGLLQREGVLSLFHTLDSSILWAENINPQVILFVFLPILIFDAAFAMDVHTFKKSVGNATILAFPGIIVSIFLSAFFIFGIAETGLGFGSFNMGDKFWIVALLFGSIISATDPVAVVALLKELGASKKLGHLIEGESMLNDGTAIVVFFVFFALLPFGIETHGGDHGALFELLKVSIGGVLMGAIIAGAVLVWVKKVFNDAMIEISLIIAAAYLTFYINEHFMHVSGVLGLVALGLAMASAGRTRISAEVQHFLHEFWELASFIANTLIFVIVGVVIAGKISITFQNLVSLLLLYIAIHIARGLMILMFYPAMKRIGYGLEKKESIILWYGGLRGGVALALALVVAGEKAIPEAIRNDFVFYIAGIVLLTLLLNATTIKLILNKLGLTKIPPVKVLMFSNVFRSVNKDMGRELEILRKDRFMGGADWNSVKQFVSDKEEISVEGIDLSGIDPLSESRRRALEKEKKSYWSQFKEGLLGPVAYKKLSDNIEEILDKEGKIPLSQRDYLNDLWQAPKFYSKLQTLPFVGGWARRALMDRLAISYDTARGFTIAQQEVTKMVTAMDFDFNEDDVKDELEQQMQNEIVEEINANRLRGLTYIKEVHEAYPEIIKAIETRQATRSLLNYERNLIHKIQTDGRLEPAEAERLMVDVERRMKNLMESPLISRILEPLEVLEQVSWLKNVKVEVIEKVKKIATEKIHLPGERLIGQGESGDTGMVVIAKGAVKVMVGEKLIDLLGSGRVIGEMSVLADVPRTATVVADTPVTALWLSSSDMQTIIKECSQLEYNLWHMAAMRFAENLLGNRAPYGKWPQIQLRRWLSEGEVFQTKDGQHIELQNKLAVLISGIASDREQRKIYKAPAVIDSAEAIFSNDAWVFILSSVIDLNES